MVLRILDANFDRAREALRVLEDLARFGLDDRPLAVAFRAERRKLGAMASPHLLSLLDARQAAEDVGAPAPGRPPETRRDLTDVAAANARRAQEALRVLEELAKLPDAPAGLDAAVLEGARFTVYDLERRLIGGLTRKSLAERVSGLYFIIDPAVTAGRDPLMVTRAALEGGARVVQWRDKLRSKGEQLPQARAFAALCREAGAVSIMNDHPDLAVAAGTDGVHLGQKDLPLAEVRRFLPLGMIIGVSTATLGEAVAASDGGADYVAVGAMFPSRSKDDTRPAGTATLRQVRARVRRPLVAIGGIGPANAAEVVQAGADALAVISAVSLADDVAEAARELVRRIAAARTAGEETMMAQQLPKSAGAES
ncbi:MAG: thiamine phosphate synthase [Chloroflexi bacterium]|nr:thiamine phosphate synthase [Chloroflexota bacterium]